jgi:hypothetical protein
MFPRSGAPVTVDLAECAVVADGDLIEDANSFIEFLLTRLHIDVTPYQVDDELVKVELETDA